MMLLDWDAEPVPEVEDLEAELLAAVKSWAVSRDTPDEQAAFVRLDDVAERYQEQEAH